MIGEIWALAYTAPVFLAWVIGAIVLFLKRRQAPHGWLLGATAFLTLAFFNAVMLGVNGLLLYHVQNGDAVALVVWQYQLLMMLSMLVQAASIGVLTLAILAGRPKPSAEQHDGNE